MIAFSIDFVSSIFRFFLDKNIKFKSLFFFLSTLANLPSPPETSIFFSL